MYKMELRKNELLEWLSQEGSLPVDRIAGHFSISLPSARRLCTQLSDEGRLVRTHGGVRTLAQPILYSFEQIRQDSNEEKARIAQYASSLVENRQVVFLESGTTLQQFAVALADRIRRGEVSHLTIITNSLVNLETLYPVAPVVMLGGQYRDARKDFVGYLSELALRGLKFDWCFIGADAVSLSDGMMATDVDTVRFDTELIRHTDKVVTLAHSGKFHKKSFLRYMGVEECACLVTDVGLPKSIRDEYRARGVNLVCV